jgi:anti-anti-sigma factor
MIPVSDRPASTAVAGRLVARTKSQGDVRTIVLGGEVDMASAQMLEETLAEACATGAKEIVVDLSGVEFMDSTGLSALLQGKAYCEAHNCSYSLTPAQRPVFQENRDPRQAPLPRRQPLTRGAAALRAQRRASGRAGPAPAAQMTATAAR